MLIVTAGSDNYKFHLTINYNLQKAKEFGYDTQVYDLGGLGFGEAIDDPRCQSRFRRVKSAMKPELLKKAMESDHRTIVWIDGDATLIRPIDEIEQDNSFDIGLTIRPKVNRKKSHYTNAGVVFIKNNEAGKQFVQTWVDAMPDVPDLNTATKPPNYSDQQTLEETLLLPNINVVPWDAFGTIHNVLGARIKFFECRKYNNFWLHKMEIWKAPDPDTKILHFKGYRMRRLKGYAEEFLDG